MDNTGFAPEGIGVLPDRASCPDETVRKILFVLCELFSIFSVIHFYSSGETDRILLCAVTIVLVMVPAAAERLFHCRLSTWLYVLCLMYALGAMLGHSYKFYYLLPGWDKLLHLTAGVVFAILGVFLPQLLDKGKEHSLLMKAAFALCFSMAVAVVWEFFEYGMDFFFHMDMQNDTVVSGINSYLLGTELGTLGSVAGIESVVVNGTALPVAGYIDIGLIDTMTDMLLESLGALLYVLIFVFDRGRHPAITLRDADNCEGRK